jgi:hypothetical protein
MALGNTRSFWFQVHWFLGLLALTSEADKLTLPLFFNLFIRETWVVIYDLKFIWSPL